MLPRAARLKRNRDFRAVYSRRKSYATPILVLYLRFQPISDPSQPMTPARFGFVISKKVSKRAHDRNLLKRRLREICRHKILPRLPQGRSVDILLVARSSATTADFARLVADVETLSRQAGLL